MVCPICQRLVRHHTDEQAMRCYEKYLRLAYADPQPSQAWVSRYA